MAQCDDANVCTTDACAGVVVDQRVVGVAEVGPLGGLVAEEPQACVQVLDGGKQPPPRELAAGHRSEGLVALRQRATGLGLGRVQQPRTPSLEARRARGPKCIGMSVTKVADWECPR